MVDDTENSRFLITYPTPRLVTVSFYIKVSVTGGYEGTLGIFTLNTMCGPGSTTISDTIGNDVILSAKVRDVV